MSLSKICCCCTTKKDETKYQNSSQTTTVRTVVIRQPQATSVQINKSQFEKECLNEHNRVRALHGCPPLTLDRKLCDYAAEWAKNLASRNILEHRSNSNYGENLFMSSGMTVNGKTAVDSWYSEIKDYRFGKGGFSSGTGHFTQVVWNKSTEIGVGFEQKGQAVWVVANYNPPGNYSGEYEQNVPPLRK